MDIICSMLSSRMGVENKLIWHYNRFRRYTTKSEYHVAKSLWDSECSHGGMGESSLTSGLSDQNIWKLNVLGKKKHFVWRIWSNSLPTRLNLFKRKVGLSSLCPLCGANN